MGLLRKIVAGYGTFMRGMSEYIILFALIALAVLVIVLPLWFLAENYPRIYSWSVALFMLLLIGAWGSLKITRAISRDGVWKLTGKAIMRAALALWFLAHGYAFIQTDMLLRVCAIISLVITVGLLLYKKQRARH